MDIEEMKQSDLSPSLVQQATTPKKTWFFKKNDGSIIAVEEKAAHQLIRNPQRVLTERGFRTLDYELIGVSDGKTYANYVNQEKKKLEGLKEEITQKKNDFRRYVKMLERFKFEEFLDDEDAKVKRAKTVIQKEEKELEELEEKYKNMFKNVPQNAFNAELEVAKGNIEMPEDFSVITPVVKDRAKILKQL